MSSATNLTNAAKLSQSVQSSLLSSRSRPKQKHKKNMENYKNIVSFISIGVLIGYSINYIYNKCYGSKIYDDEYDSDDDDDNDDIDEFHRKRISELKKSKCSMYTLPPHYALKVYQSKDKYNKDQKEKPSLSKSVSALLMTPRKKKKPKKDIFEIYNEKQVILNEIKCQIFEYKHSVKRNLLFISNESDDGYQQIKQFLDKDINNLLLIPFGHVCILIFFCV